MSDVGRPSAAAGSPRRHYDLVDAAADYPERLRSPERSLIVCTQQRSGSTFLGEALYHAGGLGCPLEYYHVGFRPQFNERWKTDTFRDYVVCAQRHRTDPSGVFAVKLFWRDVLDIVREIAPDEFAAFPPGALRPPTARRIWAILSEFHPNPVFVLLSRRDQIRQAVSWHVAARTGHWRRFDEPARPPSQVSYSFDNIVRFLAVIQRDEADWQAFFSANALPFHHLYYEDLAQNYEQVLRGLFAYLGRPEARIAPPRLRRQADARTDDMVETFRADFRALAPG